jgi:hypothetical protein
MKRSQPLRSTPSKTAEWRRRTSKPLPKHSKGHLEYAKALDAITPELVQRALGQCEANIADVCQSQGAHRHHRKRRSQGGSNDLANIILVCHACHGAIHEHPKWSRDHGLLLSRWQNENTPITY